MARYFYTRYAVDHLPQLTLTVDVSRPNIHTILNIHASRKKQKYQHPTPITIPIRQQESKARDKIC